MIRQLQLVAESIALALALAIPAPSLASTWCTAPESEEVKRFLLDGRWERRARRPWYLLTAEERDLVVQQGEALSDFLRVAYEASLSSECRLPTKFWIISPLVEDPWFLEVFLEAGITRSHRYAAESVFALSRMRNERGLDAIVAYIGHHSAREEYRRLHHALHALVQLLYQLRSHRPQVWAHRHLRVAREVEELSRDAATDKIAREFAQAIGAIEKGRSVLWAGCKRRRGEVVGATQPAASMVPPRLGLSAIILCPQTVVPAESRQ